MFSITVTTSLSGILINLSGAADKAYARVVNLNNVPTVQVSANPLFSSIDYEVTANDITVVDSSGVILPQTQRFELSNNGGNDLTHTLTVTDIETVVIATEVTQGTTVSLAGTIDTKASLSEVVSLRSSGAININAAIDCRSLDVRSTGGNIAINADVDSLTSAYIATDGNNRIVINGKIHAPNYIYPCPTWNI